MTVTVTVTSRAQAQEEASVAGQMMSSELGTSSPITAAQEAYAAIAK